MKQFRVFTEICLRLSFYQMKITKESIDICLFFRCLTWVIAGDGWPKAELRFLPWNLHHTIWMIADHDG